MRGDRPRRLLALAVAAAVAVAFADSSIVVLALPDLYSRFDTSIVGVSWVITSYNLVLAVCALALVPVVRRVKVANLSRAGLAGVLRSGSVASAVSGSLPALIVFRCVQGAGAAMLLAGSLALLSALCGSRSRGLAVWIAAGTFGAALGPALGGILTQLFDWRAIFVFQAPGRWCAGGGVRSRTRTLPVESGADQANGPEPLFGAAVRRACRSTISGRA